MFGNSAAIESEMWGPSFLQNEDRLLFRLECFKKLTKATNKILANRLQQCIKEDYNLTNAIDPRYGKFVDLSKINVMKKKTL